MPDTEPGRGREALSKEELDRRAQKAAWDEMDRMPHPVHQWMFGSLLHPRRDRKRQKDRENVATLEAKLRRLEAEREQKLHAPKQSRWWHAFWPFGR